MRLTGRRSQHPEDTEGVGRRGSGQLSFLEALTTLSARCDGSGS
jgi:hypothetical protein